MNLAARSSERLHAVQAARHRGPDRKTPSPSRRDVLALAPWLCATLPLMAVGVAVAKLSQSRWGNPVTPGTLVGAAMVVGAGMLFLLVSRLALAGRPACRLSRAVAVTSGVLVVMCGWAALVLVFGLDLTSAAVTP